MRRAALLSLQVAAGVTLGLVPRADVDAHCRSASFDAAGFWQQSFTDQRIPVFVATGAGSGITNTGLSVAEATAIVQAVIARHNEVVSVPRLFFAGATPADLTETGSQADRPDGITIDSWACGGTPRCGLDPATNGCEQSEQVQGMFPKARVTLVPPNCPPHQVSGWALDNPGGTVDTVGVVLHEIGHALGLQHSDLTRAQCEGMAGGGVYAGPTDDGTAGVMHSVTPGIVLRGRYWRRDDIEGLRAVFADFADVFPFEPAYWRDDAFPANPSPLCARLRETVPYPENGVEGETGPGHDRTRS
jgi:hypothetical protein